jgi:hypothetical protein
VIGLIVIRESDRSNLAWWKSNTREPIKKKVWLPRLRTRLPDHDDDEF